MAKNQSLAHLGLIIDGNRRWAKKHGLPTLEGHRRGYAKLKEITRWCIDAGVSYLTVYAFSTENWQRSKREVSYLMNLLRRGLLTDVEEFHAHGVQLRMVGQRNRLAADIRKTVTAAERKTAANKKLVLTLAISYGGRQEIIEAVKAIVAKKVPTRKITAELIGQQLWTAGLPDPDLIVRTSGEQRLSGFLLWGSAYSELLFIEKHWPDVTRRDFDAVISEHQNRHRRFGK